MPGRGPHHWYFVGRQPRIFLVLVALLLLDSLLGIFCFPLYEHFAHRALSAPIAVWLEGHFNAIQFTLLAAIALVFIIYRKDLRYEYRGRRGR